MIIIKTPTKLMLSGEWSVLENNNPCIVLAINKYVFVKIKKQKHNISIKAKDIRIKKLQGHFDVKSNNLFFHKKLSKKENIKIEFVKQSIELALGYLNNKNISIQNFKITTCSKNTLLKTKNNTTQKLGLGSSSAITVATISAILKWHKLDIEQDVNKYLIFKLAAAAHFLVQKKVGSGFDIAASTFGGAIIYKRFDPVWLKKNLNKTKTNWQLFDNSWPLLSIKKITLPNDFILCACYSGNSASTKNLINKINEFKKEKEELYFHYIKEIKSTTNHLIDSIKCNDSLTQERIIKLINQNRNLLKKFGETSKANLETTNLEKAINIASSKKSGSKFSGAGSGDCAIAICFDKQIAKHINNEWIKHGLQPIKVMVA